MARPKKVKRNEAQLQQMVAEIREKNRKKLDEILAIPDYQEYLGKKYYGEEKWRVTLWGNHPERTDRAKESYERMRLRAEGVYVEPKKNWNQKSVVQLDLDGNPIQKWDTAIEAALALGKTKTAALQICNNARGMAHTAYGFLWKFTDDYENEDEC